MHTPEIADSCCQALLVTGNNKIDSGLVGLPKCILARSCAQPSLKCACIGMKLGLFGILTSGQAWIMTVYESREITTTMHQLVPRSE